MGDWRIGIFLELTPYPLLSRIQTLVQQVQLNELIEYSQVIRGELGGFFERVTRFLVSFCPAVGQTKRFLRLWIVRREFRLLPQHGGGFIKAIKGAKGGGQEECGAPEIGSFFQQTGHRFNYHFSMTGVKIGRSE